MLLFAQLNAFEYLLWVNNCWKNVFSYKTWSKLITAYWASKTTTRLRALYTIYLYHFFYVFYNKPTNLKEQVGILKHVNKGFNCVLILVYATGSQIVNTYCYLNIFCGWSLSYLEPITCRYKWASSAFSR